MKAGTLIFQVLEKGGFVDAIVGSSMREGAVEWPVSHVGIAVGNGVVHVDEESGVVMEPLGMFLAGAEVSIAAVLRDSDVAKRAAERAPDFLGLPYNRSFYPDQEGVYCSELVAKCCVDAVGNPYFELCPMNFRDSSGAMIPYWIEYYKMLGLEIPEGVPGSNPRQLLNQTDLFSSVGVIRAPGLAPADKVR
jgi:hypothetical protein